MKKILKVVVLASGLMMTSFAFGGEAGSDSLRVVPVANVAADSAAVVKVASDTTAVAKDLKKPVPVIQKLSSDLLNESRDSFSKSAESDNAAARTQIDKLLETESGMRRALYSSGSNPTAESDASLANAIFKLQQSVYKKEDAVKVRELALKIKDKFIVPGKFIGTEHAYNALISKLNRMDNNRVRPSHTEFEKENSFSEHAQVANLPLADLIETADGIGAFLQTKEADENALVDVLEAKKGLAADKQKKREDSSSDADIAAAQAAVTKILALVEKLKVVDADIRSALVADAKKAKTLVEQRDALNAVYETLNEAHELAKPASKAQ